MEDTKIKSGSAAANLYDALVVYLLLLPRTLLWIASYFTLLWILWQFRDYPRSLNLALEHPGEVLWQFMPWILRWCLFYSLLFFVFQIIIWFRGPRASRERFYEFDGDHLTVGDGTGVKTTIPWQAVRSGHKTSRILLIRYSRRTYVYVLLRAFSSSEATRLIELAGKNAK